MSIASGTSGPIHSMDDDPVLVQWVEAVKARLEAGKPVDLEDYRRQDPVRAERMRRLLPAIGMMAETGTLGDFRIVREIGRGGMGIVYEAEQLSLGRRVALKVLPLAAALDSKQLQRFKQEAQAAAHLHHPNIVPVYGIGCAGGVHYYAMQFIEGQTLAERIEQARSTSRPVDLRQATG